MMRSGNPALSDAAFRSPQVLSGEQMTLNGTVNKTGLCLLLVALPAAWVWNLHMTGQPTGLYMGGFIGGFILAMVTIFKKEWSPFTVPLYAVMEGAALGALSAMFETQYPGIVMQAVGLTFMVLFALLLAYKSGMIQATENFKLGVTAATGGIALFYLVRFVLGLFGVGIPFAQGSGLLSIGISLFVVVIASLNLVMDFDFIENGAERGAPKYMEWFGAFGLLVTLIWLYIEILHLLSKLNKR